MNNVSQIIKQHNRNVPIRKKSKLIHAIAEKKNECPLNWNCKVQSVYLGIAEGNWEQRFYNHRQSFKDKRHKNDTTLSSYLWDLKENHNQIPKLTWSIVRFAPGYSNISKRCLLCLHEKLLIINYHNSSELLNNRLEVMAKCIHENKFLLSNYKGNNY